MALLHKLATNKNESDDDINSIIENLNNILNTKCGYGFFLQDFGISDYHHLNSGSDITETIIKEISDNIKRFEPRIELLKIVDVTDDKSFQLSFTLECRVQDKVQPLKLFLDPIRDCYEVTS